MDTGLKISRSGKRGSVTILLAGIMVAFLLMFLVLGIDLAYVYYVRGELQNSADAAALAGSKLLATTSVGSFEFLLLDTGSNFQELSARQEAWKFACKNKAAGANVFLVQSGVNCDTPPASGLNEGTNDPNGDIVVGYWDSSTKTFTPATGSTGNPINAVKTVPKRSADSAATGGPVRLIFGRQLINWPGMNVKRAAIAARVGLKTLPIPLCMRSCEHSPAPSPTTPFKLLLQEPASLVCSEDGMAWTTFQPFAIEPSPPIGQNRLVVQMIRGEVEVPTEVCGICVSTNNGVGFALQALEDTFRSQTYDKNNKSFDAGNNVTAWRVSVPILDTTSVCPGGAACTNPNPSCCACPPGVQPSDYHIAQIAAVEIISVDTHGGSKGITIDDRQCVGCPTAGPVSPNTALVK